jgi:hypothetical protein
MAEAQRLRWAKAKGEAQPAAPAAVAAPKPKRKLSAAGRAAIIAATRKMWARKRAPAKAKVRGAQEGSRSSGQGHRERDKISADTVSCSSDLEPRCLV